MNNNQDNLNINPQMNNTNAQNHESTNQGRFFGNTNQQTNFIPEPMPINNPNNLNQNFDTVPTQIQTNNNFQTTPITNNLNVNNNDMINVIPQNNNQGFNQSINNIPTNNIQESNIIQTPDNFNNQFNSMPPQMNNPEQPQVNGNYLDDEINEIIKPQQNRFINNSMPSENTTLNDLNVDGAYNNMPKVDYSQEPKVQENLKKKNTVTITSEGKVFILIIIVLLLFTFVMPYIFDFFRNSM